MSVVGSSMAARYALAVAVGAAVGSFGMAVVGAPTADRVPAPAHLGSTERRGASIDPSHSHGLPRPGNWSGEVASPAAFEADAGSPSDDSIARAAWVAVEGILRRARTEEQQGGPLRESPEMVANAVSEYTSGVADVFATLDDGRQRAVRLELTGRMCDEALRPAQRLTLARLVARSPQLSTRRGLDCILRSEQAEGPTLAAALDAWRRQGYPPTAAWERWRRSARRPEIRRRFEWDERMASGRPVGAGSGRNDDEE